MPAALEAEIDELITHYPQKRSASLMLLHAIQEHFGYISQEAVEWTATKLELQPINIYELVTFYPMFRQKPMGKYHLQGLPHVELRAGRVARIARTSLREAGPGRARRTGRKRRRTESSRSNLSNAWQVAAPRR